jgi:hypothetical protein
MAGELILVAVRIRISPVYSIGQLIGQPIDAVPFANPANNGI